MSEDWASLVGRLAPELGGEAKEWKGKSLVSVSQLSEAALELVVGVTDAVMETEDPERLLACLRGQVVASLFSEPSTRTACSFQAAAQRLGGGTIVSNDKFSSSTKGESLEDTVRCLACYSNFLVIRNAAPGAAMRAAATVPEMSVLNAGDGVGEHPTQALLDLYTLVREFKHDGRSSLRDVLRGKRVLMLGDLKHGRTVHSLAKLLSLFEVELLYVADAALMMPTAVIRHVHARGRATQSAHADVRDVLGDVDALYVTRLQKERFADASRFQNSYRVDRHLMDELAKPTCVVLHPLPRVDEIASDLDPDPRAAYFRQMRYGMFLRMALLALLAGTSHLITDDAAVGGRAAS